MKKSIIFSLLLSSLLLMSCGNGKPQEDNKPNNPDVVEPVDTIFATITGDEYVFNNYTTPDAPETITTKDTTPVSITVSRKSALTMELQMTQSSPKNKVLVLMTAPGKSSSNADKDEAYFEFDFGENIIKSFSFDIVAYYKEFFNGYDTGVSSDKEELKNFIDEIKIQKFVNNSWQDVKSILEQDIKQKDWTNVESEINASKIRVFANKKTSDVTKNIGRVMLDNLKFKK